MVCFEANEIFDEIIIVRERMSFHLQFDIDDISQPFHQRYSQLATDGRFGILT